MLLFEYLIWNAVLEDANAVLEYTWAVLENVYPVLEQYMLF